MDSFPNSVLPGEELFRKDFIDHNHLWRVLIMLRAEKAPRQHPGSHDLQVVRIDDVSNGPIHVIVMGWFLLAFEPEQLFIVVVQRRRPRGLGHCFYARDGTQPAVQFTKVSTDSLCAGHQHRRWRCKAERHDMMRVEAGIDLPELYKSPNHQTGPGQQHQSHCHLGYDEYALRPVSCSAAAAAALLETLVLCRTRHLQRRGKPEENSCQNRGSGCEDEDMNIEPDLLGARQSARQCRNSSMRAPAREKQTNSSTGQSQQHAFRKKLTHHPRLGCTQSGTNCKFAGPDC